MEIILKVSGILMLVCFQVCYIPQLIKTIKVKHTKDLSTATFILELLGFMFGIIFTFSITPYSYILFLNYFFGFTIISLQLYYMWRYRNA